MAAAKDKEAPAATPESLAGIAILPGDDREAADAVCRDLMAGGAERIVQLIGIVGEPEHGPVQPHIVGVSAGVATGTGRFAGIIIGSRHRNA